MSIRLGSGKTGGVPPRSRKARAPIAVLAAGALVAVGAVTPALAADTTEVRPGELGEGQADGWDLVASQACDGPADDCFEIFGELFAKMVDNPSGWSFDKDTGDGYAVLDPTFASRDGEGVVSLETRDYPLPLGEIDDMSVTLRTDDETLLGPNLTLRLTSPSLPVGCRISYDTQYVPTDPWTTFDVIDGPLPQAGGWTDYSSSCGAGVVTAASTWDQVLAVLPADAQIRDDIAVPGISISTGATDDSGYARVHVDSFTINDVTSDFEAPTLILTGTDPAAPIMAGESVEVELTGTLSGPNQPTIENNVNFLTGPGGLDSGGTFGQTGGTEGLCTVQPVDPVVMFPPDRFLPTRPSDLGQGGLSQVAREAPVTVTVTTSTTNAGGVGVSQGGTCVIGIVDPLNAEPSGGVTVTVTPAEDLREALPLPDAVPADTKPLTVSPACAVEGDILTVTAPAGSFAPESEISLGLYDSGIDLGVVLAEPDGSLSIEGPLPTGVPNGPQTVLAVGYASTDNNDPTNLSAEFQVGCPSGTGSGGSGGVPSGIPAGDGGLEDGNGFLGTGVAMLLALGGYMARRQWMRG